MGRTTEAEQLTNLIRQMGDLLERAQSAFPQFSGLRSEQRAVPVTGLPCTPLLERIYSARGRRNEIFDADAELFGEGAWDILLDLAVMEARGKRVSVTSACMASRLSPTTALRYIGVMEERGLVNLTADVADKRRRFLSLTDKARGRLDRFARSVGESADRH